ncbi:hypothetical protein [Pseudonocardia broussonetiae]|uniref:Uncharacterized protein n=1 Tax=Pseudonocardia broussonetiae TaxID=2736640 RepID=A0A6M6JLY1_9PSEU|nr:hypothetical protein [Pseudonocardia broussonetiae]QJY47311.1 hypothetical protein HOP40_17095 [Pseudonocardia broussonetiae]
MATSADGVTDRGAGPTRPALRGAAPLLGLLVTGAASPLPDGHGHLSGGEAASFLTAPLAAALGITGLLAAALVAGTALLRGADAPTRRTAIAAEAGAGYAVAVLALGWLGGGAGALASVPRTLAVVAAAVLVARARRVPTVAAGVLLAGLLAVETLLTFGPAAAGLVVSVVAGLGVLAAVACADDPVAELRRRTPLAAVALVGAAAAAAAGAVVDGLRPDAVSATSGAGVVLVTGLLLLAVTAAGWVRGRDPAHRRAAAGAAAAGSVALVSLTALLALPAPVALPDEGRPLLRTVALGGLTVPVAVVPQRPGPNLVFVGDPPGTAPTGPAPVTDVTAGGVPAAARDGAPGHWAVVDLPAGAGELVVTSGAHRAVLRLRTGADPAPADLVAGLTGPDGPECLSAVVGALVREGAEVPAACPAGALTDTDAATLRSTVRFLADRDAPSLHVVDDGSPRSTAAAAVARDAAAAHGLPLSDGVATSGAVLVVAGWETGGRRLVDEALGLSTVFGTYAAPWLATGPVLGRQTGAVTALTVDPRAEPAQRYVADLRASGVTGLASPAGLAAWGATADGGPRIFTAVQVSVMPGDHAHATDTWLPGGTFTAVTPPLPV